MTCTCLRRAWAASRLRPTMISSALTLSVAGESAPGNARSFVPIRTTTQRTPGKFRASLRILASAAGPKAWPMSGLAAAGLPRNKRLPMMPAFSTPMARPEDWRRAARSSVQRPLRSLVEPSPSTSESPKSTSEAAAPPSTSTRVRNGQLWILCATAKCHRAALVAGCRDIAGLLRQDMGGADQGRPRKEDGDGEIRARR